MDNTRKTLDKRALCKLLLETEMRKNIDKNYKINIATERKA